MAADESELFFCCDFTRGPFGDFLLEFLLVYCTGNPFGGLGIGAQVK